MGGWGSLLDRVTGWLPIPNRIEGIKNEIDKLEAEKKRLLNAQCDEKQASRVVWIVARLDKLKRMLANSAKN